MSLFEIFDHPAAVIALRCYYARWAGRRFESLGGHDAMLEDRDVITPTDIAAVSLLSVDIRPSSILDLLEGDLGRQLCELLPEVVPWDIEIGTAGARRLLEPGSASDLAWHLLRDRVGGGKTAGRAWVTAGKVLARKRPSLIPIYDRVTRCVLSLPEETNYWLWLDEQLHEGRLRDRLTELRVEADLPARTPLLRVFDVVLWMFHQKEHSYPTCDGFSLADVPRQPDCATWTRT